MATAIETVMDYFRSSARLGDSVIVSHARLAADIGLSESTVRGALKHLELTNRISVERRFGKSGASLENKYTINS